MVIVKLIGGLGNQMFQYACARRIAHRHNVSLKIDVSGFEVYKLHKYSLKHFNIIEEFAAQDEIARFKEPKGIAPRLLMKLLPYHGHTLVRERFFLFDPRLLKVSKNVYLDGYWQSERYFNDIKDIICNEFTAKHEPDVKNKEMIQNILGINAVSLHIRRGDYVSNLTTNQVHGVCSLEYYQQAVSIISQRVENPIFFVFSDDPEWVKQNLKIAYPIIFVDHNDADKNFEDLRLMSLCKHHIIANSSFSWWGAWLGNNLNKNIVAPKKWFSKEDVNTQDLIPERWIRI